MQVTLTKVQPSFSLINKSIVSKTVFKLLDAQLLVSRVKSNPAILLAQYSTLNKQRFSWYKLTSVEHKTFTFSA